MLLRKLRDRGAQLRQLATLRGHIYRDRGTDADGADAVKAVLCA